MVEEHIQAKSVSKYNLVYTTNNIYLTQKQGGGASNKIIDGGCSGRYSPSIYTNTTSQG